MSTANGHRRKAYRICPLCEATCGLELTIDGDTVTVRSAATATTCSATASSARRAPRSSSSTHDPDRLRPPAACRDDGELAGGRLGRGVRRRRGAGCARSSGRHGRDAVGVYLGNPNVHTMAGGALRRPAASRRSAPATSSRPAPSTRCPSTCRAGYLFGDPLAIPVPDLDRTDFLLMLGANPCESNGSLCTAPDFPGRLKALQARGGRLVVVDPRRTRTADAADEHLAIRPGTDALLLFGDRPHAVRRGPRRARPARRARRAASTRCGTLAADVHPRGGRRPSAACRPGTIRRLARELAAAPTAAVYGRIGTCTVAFGTLASWLVDVLNVLTGNLDRPGGAMFPLAAHQPAAADRPRRQGFATGRWHSRVRGLPEVAGRAAGRHPGRGDRDARATARSGPSSPSPATRCCPRPNGDRLDAALAALEFMVSVDPYLNETTRHADVILPPPTAAQRGHYDFAFTALAVRNVASYSPPVLPLDRRRAWTRARSSPAWP